MKQTVLAFVAAVAGVVSGYAAYVLVHDRESSFLRASFGMLMIPVGVDTTATVVGYLMLHRYFTSADVVDGLSPWAVFGSIIVVAAISVAPFAGYFALLFDESESANSGGRMLMAFAGGALQGAFFGAMIALPIAIVAAVSIWVVARWRAHAPLRERTY